MGSSQWTFQLVKISGMCLIAFQMGRQVVLESILDDDTGCELEDDDIMICYYNDSYLVEGESNAWQHAVNALTTSYLYEIAQDDGNSLVLTNDIGMRMMPPYLVGVKNDDASKAVFVGGYHLDDLKKYANSVEFK